MSTLNFIDQSFKSADLGAESSLPLISDLVETPGIASSDLSEDDGLCISYGAVRSSFPYRSQDNYSRELYDTVYNCAVLENEYLRAVFIPALGGKLWSLFDKEHGRELLFSNPVVRPCNLAIRNAWTSGGVEWNLGFLGHHPYTCSPVFTAITTLDDSTPVLRMYYYERLRGQIAQMDFFLPDGSRLLYARMRVVNPNDEVTPVYWWSNIAVPELKRGRVIVGADASFTSDAGAIRKVGVPIYDGHDVTYPTNLPHAVDFFFDIPQNRRKYEAHLDENGFGLCQTSTSRLIGRKLFVWGQGPGGDRWQQYLTSDDCSGRYVEIQAGLAHSQFESLPMPPKTTWEWLEAYGALSCDVDKIHGDWHGAQDECERVLNEHITDAALEKLLCDTKGMAHSKAELISAGDGWAALENIRRARRNMKPLEPHLDFGETGEMQRQWTSLLDTGVWGKHMPLEAPPSYILSKNWTPLIRRAAESYDEFNWYAHYQYGITLLASGDTERARAELERSIELEKNPWAMYGLAQLYRLYSQNDRAALMTLHAAELAPNDISLAREAMRMLNSCGKYSLTASFIEGLCERVKAVPRVKLYLAQAYVKLGRAADAEKLIMDGGGLVVADIREGEVSITDLWYDIEEQKAVSKGKTFDRATAKPPVIFDFRMNAEK